MTAADLPARVAMLEEIARGIKAVLERIERRLDGIDLRLDWFSREHNAQFRWLLGIMLGGFALTFSAFAGLLAVMAHGFHWL